MGTNWNDPWEEWDNSPALIEDEQDRTIGYPERCLDVLISIAIIVLAVALFGLALIALTITWPAIPLGFWLVSPILLLILIPIGNGIYNKIRNM